LDIEINTYICKPFRIFYKAFLLKTAMKNCPNCHEEIEDNFEICWNCNYSMTENKVIEFEDPVIEGTRKINCLRCDIAMIYSGNYKFHEGTRLGMFGNLMEAFINRESFDLYLCPKCGKVEFFTALTNP